MGKNASSMQHTLATGTAITKRAHPSPPDHVRARFTSASKPLAERMTTNTAISA